MEQKNDILRSWVNVKNPESNNGIDNGIEITTESRPDDILLPNKEKINEEV